ncbi:MAG: aminopeptidase [Bacteroidetes bacterium]|nr:MAG: aminopeptidase [Bacteroidota bacterium]
MLQAQKPGQAGDSLKARESLRTPASQASTRILPPQGVLPRDLGIVIGEMETGRFNAITDVSGVSVGHVTKIEGCDTRTGVTAILPHPGNIFQQKVPAAIYIGNGFGKLIGYSQVRELGNIETPIILTNTLSVAIAADALIDYSLEQPGNGDLRSVNPLVGETNDGYLNDIRKRGVSKADVFEAIANADTGRIEQGNVGAGTGTVCFGYKGGIGTSSRILPSAQGGYTVGVLVQSNFGGQLTVAGVALGQELLARSDAAHIPPGQSTGIEHASEGDGSCMIVVATDAPLTSRNLERLAKRALLGLGRTGGTMSNGSGDYVIAFSTSIELRVPHKGYARHCNAELPNEAMTPLFQAVIEASEEAILCSLFAAEDMSGYNAHEVSALPLEESIRILKKHGCLEE